MNFLTEVAARTAEISAGASLLILALFLAGGATRKAFAARWRYWAWLVLAVRLLVPLHFAAPAPAVTIPAPRQSLTVTVPAARNAGSAAVAVSEEARETAEPLPARQETRTVPLRAVLAVLWAGGAACCLVWTAVSSAQFRRRYLRWSSEEPDSETLHLFREACTAAGAGNRIRLMRCKKGISPMMTGLFRPVLLLPAEAFTPGELRVVFRHELTHYKRRDLWYKLLLAAACAFHWFNPLVWLMVREANRDLELSCDEAALLGAEPAFREEYGRAVLSVAQKGVLRRSMLSTCFGSGKKELRRRLETILDTKGKRRGAAALCLVLVLAIACGAFIACGPRTVGFRKDGKAISARQARTMAKQMIQARTKYIGNASAVGRVLGTLPPLPDGITQKEISLQTSAKPYGLTVSYMARNDEVLTKTDLVWAYRNAALLLSLIQNAGRITFQVSGPDCQMTFTYTQEQAAKLEQTDVRKFSQGEAEMGKFLMELQSRSAADFNGREVGGLTADQEQHALEKSLSASAQLMLLREQTFGGADFHLFCKVPSFQSPRQNRRYAVSKDGSTVLTLENPCPPNSKAQKGSAQAGALPSYVHHSDQTAESAVYQALAQFNSEPCTPGNVVINAPAIYGSFEENGVLRIFATVHSAEYELDGDVLNSVSGGSIPMELRFSKNGASWRLSGHTAAKDGSYFADSIRSFCAPHSDVAKKMLSNYGTGKNFDKLMKKNLQEYVRQSGLKANCFHDGAEDIPIFS